MADDKKEPWLNYLALTTVILAVCATLSTFKGGGHSTKAVMSQSQASDQWAYYQAKSIKLNLYEIQREKIQVELSALNEKTQKPLMDAYKKKIEDYSKKVEKYETEKTAIQAEAKKLEGVRDDSQKHSRVFGMAVIYLQIAILLSSIAALLKKKLVWLLGVGVGVVGVWYFANGLLLITV
ncbi:MAG: DUF4337 domain-containing protein [Nitrospinae bacterium]|nr:DUF4337 domain-containing protein [Nitrospinota bacterium]